MEISSPHSPLSHDRKSSKALVIILAIVMAGVLIILGVFGNSEPEEYTLPTSPSGVVTTTESGTVATEITPPSVDEIAELEAELNATNFSELDIEINDFDTVPQ